MKIIISSSKTMKQQITDDCCLPVLIDQSKLLLDCIKKLDEEKLASILDCDKQKANQYYSLYQKMDLNNDLTMATKAYDGVVFKQFNHLIDDNMDYLNEHLRIISAFYGILEANDGIKNYRLDMANKLRIDNKNLYQFWDGKIYQQLKDDIIINLASEEYGKCVRNYLDDKTRLVDIDFVELIDSKEKRISSNIKKARGNMLSYMILNKVESIEELKQFDYLGYHYNKDKSDTNKLVFVK